MKILESRINVYWNLFLWDQSTINQHCMVQVMACRLFGAKPLPEPMLADPVHRRIYAGLGGVNPSKFQCLDSGSSWLLNTLQYENLIHSKLPLVYKKRAFCIIRYQLGCHPSRFLKSPRPTPSNEVDLSRFTHLSGEASSKRHSPQISTWWRHQMEPFPALLAICAGHSPVTGELPAQRPVTGSYDVLFDLRLNKRLSKQCRDWLIETPSRPLWRHCNAKENALFSLNCKRNSTNVVQKLICLISNECSSKESQFNMLIMMHDTYKIDVGHPIRVTQIRQNDVYMKLISGEMDADLLKINRSYVRNQSLNLRVGNAHARSLFTESVPYVVHNIKQSIFALCRHWMETFPALLAICAGNSSVTGKFPAQRPVTRSFDGFVYLRLNKRLSKQSRSGWFETLSRQLWRHCNGIRHNGLWAWRSGQSWGRLNRDWPRFVSITAQTAKTIASM